MCVPCLIRGKLLANGIADAILFKSVCRQADTTS